MKAFAALCLAIYFVAWWLTFWLPMRRHGAIAVLAFVPTALCSIAIPMIISDITVLQKSPLASLMWFWFSVPIVLVIAMLVRGMCKARRKADPPRVSAQSKLGANESSS